MILCAGNRVAVLHKTSTISANKIWVNKFGITKAAATQSHFISQNHLLLVVPAFFLLSGEKPSKHIYMCILNFHCCLSFFPCFRYLSHFSVLKNLYICVGSMICGWAKIWKDLCTRMTPANWFHIWHCFWDLVNVVFN